MDSLLSSPYGTWIFGAAVGLTLALVLLGVLSSSGVLLDPVRRRLRTVETLGGEAAPGVLGQIGSIMQPRNAQARQTLQLSLIQAGWRAPGSLGVMYAVKATLVLTLPATVVVVLLSLPELRPSQLATSVLLAVAAVAGWWLPNYVLRRRVHARQARLMGSLPDALDLLVACTEAGLGLNAAIERVADQLPASSPELAVELSLVNNEIRAGVDRMEALRNLAVRTGLQEIRGLVSLINHSMRFGTGIAATLRVYAEEFRDRRLQRAEEAAATIGTRLVFPLVFCIFPAFFVVAIGPAIVGVFSVLGESGAFQR